DERLQQRRLGRTEMPMRVDEARHHRAAAGVDDVGGAARRCARADGANHTAFHHDRAVRDLAAHSIEDARIGDGQILRTGRTCDDRAADACQQSGHRTLHHPSYLRVERLVGARAASASCLRAPARIPNMPRLPSWHAYSISGSSICFIGIRTVHGCVHVAGSLIVTSYCNTSGAMRVKRSTRWSPVDDPIMSLFAEKPIVSTTSVSPSQCPRELPSHCKIDGDRCGCPSSGITRALWIVSMTKTTSCGDCTTSNTLLYAAVRRGTPNVMQRSLKPRLHGPSAGCARRRSAAAARRACASGVYGGIRPFGGSMISDVRRSKSRGGSQNPL